jgi:hypothetical protein
MAWLAALCVLLGVFPVWMIEHMDHVTYSLLGHSLAASGASSHWLWLTPVAAERASYSPVIFLAVIVTVVLLTFWLVRRIYHGRLRRGPAWDCGFPELDARMQDTPEGFAQPVRQVFAPVYEIEARVPGPFDPAPRYHVEVRDRFWRALYGPVADAAAWATRLLARLQGGRIAVYLLYSFGTLLILLAFVR